MIVYILFGMLSVITEMESGLQIICLLMHKQWIMCVCVCVCLCDNLEAKPEFKDKAKNQPISLSSPLSFGS